MATVRRTVTRTTTVPVTNVVTPVETTRVIRNGYWESTISRIIWTLFGILAFFLVLRIAFLLLSANPNAGFTQFIYDMTQPFVTPFEGIFPAPSAAGSYFDTAAIVALIVWALVTWGITAIIDAIDRKF